MSRKTTVPEKLAKVTEPNGVRPEPRNQPPALGAEKSLLRIYKVYSEMRMFQKT